MKKPFEDHLYFIAAPIEPDGSRWVKIGRAANLANRLQSLQCGCPYLLEILYVKVGAGSEEGVYHTNFAHSRGVGEWFLFSKDDIALLSSKGSATSGLLEEHQECARERDRKRKRSRKRLENPEYRERQRQYMREYRTKKKNVV